MTYGWVRVGEVGVELCDECGFDGRLIDDLAGGLHHVLSVLDAYNRMPLAEVKPAPEVFSANEYVDHCVWLVNAYVEALCDFIELPRPPKATDCSSASVALSVLFDGFGDRDLDTLDDGEFMGLPVSAQLRHVLHDLEHHVLDIRRGYAKLTIAAGEDIHLNRR